MKKALRIGWLFLLFLVPFSVSKADTFYQQLSDSTRSVEIITVGSGGPLDCYALGSFTVAQDVTVDSSGRGFLFMTNKTGTPFTFHDYFNVQIATTSVSGNTCALTPTIAQYDSFATVQAQANPQLVNLFSAGGPVTLYAGVVYYLNLATNTRGASSGGHILIAIGTPSSSMFGALNTDGVASIPVTPGIPGFTDVGVSTTSQQEYCGSSFSTSTGFLDSLGRSISLGFCNVGAFLFIPSQQTLNQFQGLASTSQNKIPFAYFFDVKSIYDNSTATTTQNVPTFSINLGLIDFASSTAMGHILPTNLDFFSKGTIDKFLPVGMHDLIYNLMIYAIWVDLMYVLYRRIVPSKPKL